ncbi:MAG: TetR/AcrR family transcriptional regulator [Myxococcota bacterium]
MTHYWTAGLHAASVNELCRRVGISKPGLYREFGGEDGLMDAALECYRGQAVLPLLALMAEDRPFVETFDRCLAAMTQDDKRPPGCLFTRMRLDRGHLGPQTRDRLESVEHERLRAFEVFFVRARDRNEAASHICPAFAAEYVDAQLTLLLTRMVMGDPAAAVEETARLSLEPLRATK